jgi:endogenous inhibitor of DNA gyrase (YacG/DUF329 family)
MPESMLGRRVRCFGCDERFVATPDSATAPPPQSVSRPRPSATEDQPAPLPAPRAADDDASRDGPYCPGCGRKVPWQGRYCPHCGEEFDDADVVRASRGRYRFRRDTVPHRGALLTTLGNISLAAGALSLCLFGAGAIVGIPLGIAVWVMAQTDLAQMREGIMDSQGRHLTETARASAITGLILSLLFAAGYGAMFLTTL